MARQAQDGDVVSVHYTGRLEDGTIFDSSRDGEPIEFELGSGSVIPGIEDAIRGMEVGDTREVRLAPEAAYGERREDLHIDVPRDQLPPDLAPEVGQLLAVQVAPGQQAVARIADVNDAEITLDLNHPLAGQTLVFDIELVGIR
ncbi:MAG TPA: peptidylprolyl isomerase [Longimicrobiales bacterium]|nr:peptidylprolyl isomerase [Longimicrobiales bacterium]